MSAYELVDWLSKPRSSGEEATLVKEFAIPMLRQQADRIAHLEMLVANRNEIIDKLDLTPQTKPLSDEEIYALWCEADNTELLPEMRLKDGSINYIITTFAKLIEERHGIK